MVSSAVLLSMVVPGAAAVIGRPAPRGGAWPACAAGT
jgi:hypothetical protein